MGNLGRLSTLVALVAIAGALALASSPADANSPVEIKVVAEQEAGACPGCELDLVVSGTMIDKAGSGVFTDPGNLKGTAEFKDATGAEFTLNIDRSQMIAGTDPFGNDFIMIRLTDTEATAGQPGLVEIRLMPVSPIVRVRNGSGGLLVEYSSGEYSVQIELE